MKPTIHATDGREIWLYAHPQDNGDVTITLGDPNLGFSDPVVLSAADALALGQWLIEAGGES
jgi:hypothetical protein